MSPSSHETPDPKDLVVVPTAAPISVEPPDSLEIRFQTGRQFLGWIRAEVEQSRNDPIPVVLYGRTEASLFEHLSREIRLLPDGVSVFSAKRGPDWEGIESRLRETSPIVGERVELLAQTILAMRERS